MFTRISNIDREPSDLVSYAKWFKLQGLSFSIKMHDVDKWVASTKTDIVEIETSFQEGPVAAIKELHKLLRPLISKK